MLVFSKIHNRTTGRMISPLKTYTNLFAFASAKVVTSVHQTLLQWNLHLDDCSLIWLRR